MTVRTFAAACAMAAGLLVNPAAFAAEAPNASDLLFEAPQLANTQAGTTLTYRYTRASEIEGGPFGAPMTDEIKIQLQPGQTAKDRTAVVQMFSGTNRRPAGPFTDMSGNPVLILFLEYHLDGLAKVLLGNPRYIKLAIRKALRDKASVSPTEVDYKGGKVPGWRVEIKPFAGDKEAGRMRGLENLVYSFVTADAVPGEIVSIDAKATSPEGGKLLEETLTYEPNAG